MPKPLIVGEAPSRRGDPRKPIAGPCGDRLADLAGRPVDEFLASYDRANVLGAWPGSAGRRKGSAFPLAQAKPAANRLVRRFVRGRVVVLLGRRVAAAFRVEVDYFEWTVVRSARVVVIPHPSRVNKWWNDARNVETARAFMRELSDATWKDERNRISG